MNVQELKKIARQRGLQVEKAKKHEIIRAIQADEKNDPCFATGMTDQCGQSGCLWREDCA